MKEKVAVTSNYLTPLKFVKFILFLSALTLKETDELSTDQFIPTAVIGGS
jgi:hypothetical protein